MTIFGTDLSSNNAGLTVAELKEAGFSFLTARALSFPNGNMIEDSNYAGWRDEARAAGFPFACYVLWHTYYTPYDQARELARIIGDKSIPILMDMEPDSSNPTIEFEAQCWDACKVQGLNPRVLYDPRWYWNEEGGPALNVRPWRLVSSAYGSNRAGSPSAVYAANGGDGGSGWNEYGGLAPAIWQFGSQLQCAGHVIDGDAFKGTVADLIHTGMFTDWGDSMALDPKDPVVKTIIADIGAVKSDLDNLGNIIVHGDAHHPNSLDALQRGLSLIIHGGDGYPNSEDALAGHITQLQAALTGIASTLATLQAGQVDAKAVEQDLIDAGLPELVAQGVAAHLTLATK